MTLRADRSPGALSDHRLFGGAPEVSVQSDQTATLARVLDTDDSSQLSAVGALDLHPMVLCLPRNLNPSDGATKAHREPEVPAGRGDASRSAVVLSHPVAPSNQSAGEGIRTPAFLPELRLRRPPPYRAEPPPDSERGERDSNPRGPAGPAAHKAVAVTALSHPRTSIHAIAYRVYSVGVCDSIRLAR